jgi:hypothetical protein
VAAREASKNQQRQMFNFPSSAVSSLCRFASNAESFLCSAWFAGDFGAKLSARG